MKRIILAALIGVLVSGPAYGASLNDIFSGIGDKLSEIWHADIFPDDVGSEVQEPTQSASEAEAPFSLIIIGILLVFITGLFLRREWLHFLEIKNDVKGDRIIRAIDYTLIGGASLIIGVFFLSGGMMIFGGCALLLGY